MGLLVFKSALVAISVISATSFIVITEAPAGGGFGSARYNPCPAHAPNYTCTSYGYCTCYGQGRKPAVNKPSIKSDIGKSASGSSASSGVAAPKNARTDLDRFHLGPSFAGPQILSGSKTSGRGGAASLSGSKTSGPSAVSTWQQPQTKTWAPSGAKQ